MAEAALPVPLEDQRPARRRPAGLRIDHQPGVVLHSTAWRETSLIVEAFTRDFGRIALVARGAKRPTSQFRGMLAPFCPVALSWSGRNDIRNLVRAEWVGGLPPLRGDALLAAFYASELLVRLLARGDPHVQLFGNYLGALQALAEGPPHAPILRGFELDLLREIGYAVPLDSCIDGRPIDADARYVFDAGAGARRLETDRGDNILVAGRTLLALAQRDFRDAEVASESKALLRRLIRYHLDDKPLNTRRILQDLKNL